jgi:succinate dehydrogenase/fumarate reductase flavoprotein subunit
MPEKNALSRRDFLKGAAVAGAGAAALGLVGCDNDGGGATSGGGSGSKIITLPHVEKWDYEADVVVCGFGFAGQGAAVEANNLGNTVFVVDRAPREHCGGSSASKRIYTSGLLGPDPETNIKYVTSECWGTTDAETIRMQIEMNHKLPAWIESIGGTVTWQRTSIAYPVIPGGADMSKSGTGPENGFVGHPPAPYEDKFPQESYKPPWTEWMLDMMAERDIPVKHATPLVELIQNGETGEIIGIKAAEGITFAKGFEQNSDGTPIYIKANKGVVIATGGYEHNEELLKQFAPHAHSAFVTMYGSPYSDGSGMIAAAKVGAQLWHTNKKEMHSFGCAPLSKELGVGVTVSAWATNIGGFPGIVVNRYGKRFYNEYFNGGHSDNRREWDRFVHHHLPADDEEYCDYPNVPMYFIFDETTRKEKRIGGIGQFQGNLGVYKWSEDNSVEVDKGYIIKADSIEELAGKITSTNFFGVVEPMDKAALAKTVSDYNGYCATGVDLEFGRRGETMLPLVTPPFYAMEICECQTNTQGGPKHNGHCQVLDAFDKPIPRLYVAGELGSIYGHLYNGMENIPETLSSGIRAARHANDLTPWDA